MNSINPYSRNTEVLSRFFSRPLILLIAIVFAIAVLSQTIYAFFQFETYNINDTSGYSLFPLSVSVLDILPTIAFFLFYFKSKSKKPNLSYKAPIVLIKIYSIVGIVLISIAALFLILAVTLINSATAAVNSEIFKFFGDIFNILIIMFFFALIPVFAVGLLYFIAMLTLFGSVNKSANSIYLRKSGSVFFAIMAIILAVLSLLITLSSTPVLNNALADLPSDILAGLNNAATSSIFTIVCDIVYIIAYALLAVFALSYRKYISKVSTAIVAEPVQNNNISDKSGTPKNAVGDAVKFTPQPVNFTPQPVFGNNNANSETSYATENSTLRTNNSAAEPVHQTQSNSGQNPYVANHQSQDNPYYNNSHIQNAPYYRTQTLQAQQNLYKQNPYMNATQNPYADANNIPSKVYCPNCGYECTDGSAFCGNCGYIVNRRCDAAHNSSRQINL